ncbi:hypothetical protein HDV00_002632 [Rhizophlyctis rosea]|nr:hypothetical protein HDV00_002632 [Rhizophlyctis rosea]
MDVAVQTVAVKIDDGARPVEVETATSVNIADYRALPEVTTVCLMISLYFREKVTGKHSELLWNQMPLSVYDERIETIQQYLRSNTAFILISTVPFYWKGPGLNGADRKGLRALLAKLNEEDSQRGLLWTWDGRIKWVKQAGPTNEVVIFLIPMHLAHAFPSCVYEDVAPHLRSPLPIPTNPGLSALWNNNGIPAPQPRPALRYPVDPLVQMQRTVAAEMHHEDQIKKAVEASLRPDSAVRPDDIVMNTLEASKHAPYSIFSDENGVVDESHVARAKKDNVLPSGRRTIPFELMEAVRNANTDKLDETLARLVDAGYEPEQVEKLGRLMKEARAGSTNRSEPQEVGGARSESSEGADVNAVAEDSEESVGDVKAKEA